MRTIDLQTQIKFERILLATDFSAGAEMAQAYAVGLALQDGSTLQLTTVVTLPSLDAISECALDSVRHSSEEDLHRLANDIPKVKVTRKVIEGFQPAASIVDEAAHSHADLIVLGTTSKQGLKKFALGSTAEHVIRTAPCPILTIGPRVPRPSSQPISFKRIVYATDFSPQATKAAAIALSLAHTNGAQLHLCNVVSDSDGESNYGYEVKSLSSLQALMPESSYDWCHPECIVDHRRSSDAILSFAERVNADLIVLGARRTSFWIEYVRTGLTPALLASATCPVLTVC